MYKIGVKPVCTLLSLSPTSFITNHKQQKALLPLKSQIYSLLYISFSRKFYEDSKYLVFHSWGNDMVRVLASIPL